jgi:hypothetical protein
LAIPPDLELLEQSRLFLFRHWLAMRCLTPLIDKLGEHSFKNFGIRNPGYLGIAL